ncbi:MAG: formylglycine-generating enzyme family protein [Acidobacteriota bacterium]|nr:formylglycine-generating enzyme family protein [Acidobacteriota bacterium]
MRWLRIGTVAAVALGLQASGAEAQRLMRQDGVELRGSSRVAAYAAAECVVRNGLEGDDKVVEPANRGQPLDVWQLDVSVYNGSGKWLEDVDARYEIQSERPPCSSWDGPPAGTVDGVIGWAGHHDTVQARNVGPGETVTETVFLIVFHDHEPPRFSEWSLQYDFAPSPPSRQPGDTFRDSLRSGGSGPELVVIPAGSFRMGCVSGVDCRGDETPVHEVTIPRPFAVSKYEVTFAEWDACVSAGGCSHRPGDRGWGRGRRPVIHVSWQDAQEHVRWLSEQTGGEYRLLSESEWEYAARAGSSTAYSWGNEIGSGRANCVGCGSEWDNLQTAPAGSFSGNAFGLHGMHGNVGEWVEDCWNGNYDGAPSNGTAWQSGDCSRRVLRGGSWGLTRGYLRSANRGGYFSGTRNGRVGFRVARTLPP